MASNPPPLLSDVSTYPRRIESRVETPKGRHSPPRLGWPKGVGFCRSRGLAAAYDDAAVHEAGIDHFWTFNKRKDRRLRIDSSDGKWSGFVGFSVLLHQECTTTPGPPNWAVCKFAHVFRTLVPILLYSTGRHADKESRRMAIAGKRPRSDPVGRSTRSLYS